MMRRIKKKIAGAKAIAAIFIVVSSCSSQPPRRETREIGEPTNYLGSVANATVLDAETPPPPAVMPENPSHISLCLPKVPRVIVTTVSGEVYPYPITVQEKDDQQVVTMYLPQGRGMDVAITAIDELGEPVQLTVEPEAKLGTSENDLVTGDIIHFSGGAQKTLQLGENLLDGPITDEFIDGAIRSVLQGVYTSDVDRVVEVAWTGCTVVYSFLDEVPVLRTEPFSVSLRANQNFGLYPVVGETGSSVSFTLTLSELICPSE